MVIGIIWDGAIHKIAAVQTFLGVGMESDPHRGLPIIDKPTEIDEFQQCFFQLFLPGWLGDGGQARCFIPQPRYDAQTVGGQQQYLWYRKVGGIV